MCLSTTFFKQHIFKHPFFTASNLVKHGRAPSAYLQDSMVWYGMDLAHLNFLSLTFEFGYIRMFHCAPRSPEPRLGDPTRFLLFPVKLTQAEACASAWLNMMSVVETCWNHRCFLLRIGVLNTIITWIHSVRQSASGIRQKADFSWFQ